MQWSENCCCVIDNFDATLILKPYRVGDLDSYVCVIRKLWLSKILQILCLYNLQGRTNLPPEKVPWDAIKTLLSDCIYGGKIDNEFDQVRILSHLKTCFANFLTSIADSYCGAFRISLIWVRTVCLGVPQWTVQTQIRWLLTTSKEFMLKHLFHILNRWVVTYSEESILF